MKSLFPDSIMSSVELNMESIASKLTYLQLQFHLIHWQTVGYAEHQAVGGAYDYIHDFKDGLMEKLMGYTNRRVGIFKLEPLTQTTATSLASEAMLFASALKQFGESNGYHDVCNLADDFSGEMAKLRYLLTLS